VSSAYGIASYNTIKSILSQIMKLIVDQIHIKPEQSSRRGVEQSENDTAQDSGDLHDTDERRDPEYKISTPSSFSPLNRAFLSSLFYTVRRVVNIFSLRFFS
jgi:hypothetical protein